MGYAIVKSTDEDGVPVFWELQLGRRFGTSPALACALASGVVILACVGIRWLTGAPLLDASQTFGLQEWLRSFLLMAVLAGYVLGAFDSVAAAHDRELVALGLLEPRDIEARRMPGRTRRHGRWAGAVGIVAGLLVLEAVQRSLTFGASALDLLFSVDFSPMVVLNMLTGWILGRAIFLSTQRTPLDDVIEGPVDLMNLEPFFAHGRSAVRSSVAFVLGISLLAPWVFIPGFGYTFLFFIGAALVIPVLALLVPAYGAHRRLRHAKRAELERIDREIRERQRAAVAGDPEAQDRMRFWMGYRGHVQELPDWPFESRIFRRFGFYLLIPLGSWLASALVERLVDATLD